MLLGILRVCVCVCSPIDYLAGTLRCTICTFSCSEPEICFFSRCRWRIRMILVHASMIVLVDVRCLIYLFHVVERNVSLLFSSFIVSLWMWMWRSKKHERGRGKILEETRRRPAVAKVAFSFQLRSEWIVGSNVSRNETFALSHQSSSKNPTPEGLHLIRIFI